MCVHVQVPGAPQHHSLGSLSTPNSAFSSSSRRSFSKPARVASPVPKPPRAQAAAAAAAANLGHIASSSQMSAMPKQSMQAQRDALKEQMSGAYQKQKPSSAG